jgi:hypothetical protein
MVPEKLQRKVRGSGIMDPTGLLEAINLKLHRDLLARMIFS